MKKKKKTQALDKKIVVVEPTRTSVLDLLLSNLEIAGRVIFIHRLVYVGEHSFPAKFISEAIKNVCMKANSGYCTERITGVLLSYDTFFCHIVDAAEDVLNRHLCILFDEYDERLKKVKLLSVLHHVKSRFTEEWLSYHGNPPQRIEEIDHNSNLENSMRYVRECCEKLYKFAAVYVADQCEEEEEGEGEDNEFFIQESQPNFRRKSSAIDKRKETKAGAIVDRDPYSEFLPELKLLDFLVNCKFLRDLRKYKDYYGHILKVRGFEYKVWPAPYNFIRYDVFDKPYEPIQDLPTKAKNKETSNEDVLLDAIVMGEGEAQ